MEQRSGVIASKHTVTPTAFTKLREKWAESQDQHMAFNFVMTECFELLQKA